MAKQIKTNQQFADQIFKTFFSMVAFNGYQTLAVEQNTDRVQVFDLLLSRNGFQFYPEACEYRFYDVDKGWQDPVPVFTTLELMRSSHLGLDYGRQLDLLVDWVSKTTS